MQVDAISVDWSVQPEKPPTGTEVVKSSLNTWFQPGRFPVGIGTPDGLLALTAEALTPTDVNGSVPPMLVSIVLRLAGLRRFVALAAEAMGVEVADLCAVTFLAFDFALCRFSCRRAVLWCSAFSWCLTPARW